LSHKRILLFYFVVFNKKGKANSEFGIQREESGARREGDHADLFRTNVLHGIMNEEKCRIQRMPRGFFLVT
jgi:hypothetical protein